MTTGRLPKEDKIAVRILNSYPRNRELTPKMKKSLIPALVLFAVLHLLASCGHVHHLPRQPRAAVVGPHLTMKVSEERRVLSATSLARLSSPLSMGVPLPPRAFLRVSDPSVLKLDSNRHGDAIVRGLRPGIADVSYRDDDELTRIRVVR